jgi:Ion channel
MIVRLLVSSLLMAVCVAIHAAGLAWAIRRLRRSPIPVARYWPSLRLFVTIAVWIVLLHLVEIGAWAALYRLGGALPDAMTAFYFSAVTYTTTGYGDIVLPPPWRFGSAVEALTGILMCGWSTGFFFAVVNRLHQPQATPTGV